MDPVVDGISDKKRQDPVRVLMALAASGRRADAVRLLAELRKLTDIPGHALLRLAQLAGSLGEFSVACELAERFAGGQGAHPPGVLQAAAVLAGAGRFTRALTLAESALGKAPDDPSLNHFLGTVQQQLGNQDEAGRLLLDALSRAQLSGITWLTLAAQHRFEPDDPLLDRMEGLRTAFAGAPSIQRVPFRYALGKAYVDIGDANRAFDEFVDAGEGLEESTRYDPARERAAVDGIIAASSELSADIAGERSDSDDPAIFVVGLPRSGTTLLQRLLTTRPGVVDGAEFPGMAVATMDYRRQHPADGNQPRDAEALLEVGRIYRHLVSERFGTDERIVDKNITNTLYAGLIAGVFPSSPIILIERDPADVAWSCLRTHFSQGQPWSWTLPNIAAHLQAEYRLMAHWKRVLAGRVVCIRYEELVRRPASVLPDLCARLNLPYDESMLEFHRQRGTGVTTASVVQVSAPLADRSVGKSDTVRDRLGRQIVEMSDRYRNASSA